MPTQPQQDRLLLNRHMSGWRCLSLLFREGRSYKMHCCIALLLRLHAARPTYLCFMHLSGLMLMPALQG